MKLFKRIKHENGKRELFLFGIKIYSYTKKTNPNDCHLTNPVELNGYDLAENARKLGVKIGEGTYVCSGTVWGNQPYFIEIGKNCLLSLNISFLNHDGSTHTCEQYFSKPCFNVIFGKIKIGDNCFIGCQSVILPNVTIGNDCIIGAGSVVTKNVPDGEVWAGNPAHFIKKTKDLAEKQELLLHSEEQIALQNLYKNIENNKTQI